MTSSICIPRVMYFVNSEQITSVFAHIFGENLVSQVDMIERQDNKTGEGFYLVFVHFNSTNEHLDPFMSKLESEGEVKVIYQEPWFWKCKKSISKPKPPRNGPRIMSVEDEKSFMEYQKNRLQPQENGEPSEAEANAVEA